MNAVWQISAGLASRSYADEGGHTLEPLAYAKLAWLKQPAADLFARLRRP